MFQMKKQENNNLLEAANVKIKTYFAISGITLLVIIDIAKIKEDKFYLLKEDAEFYKVSFERDNVYLVDQKSPSFFYGKFQDVNSAYRMLSILFDFLDNETIIDSHGNTILTTLKLSIKKIIALNTLNIQNNLPITKQEFCDFMLSTGIISFEELVKIYNELIFYIERCRNIFVNNVTECLNFEKSFPFISIKPKDSDIPKNMLEKASQTIGMSELSSAIEFGGTILFRENIGKSYEDWSWRERHIRRMYLDLKARTDNYIEELKCKQMET